MAMHSEHFTAEAIKKHSDPCNRLVFCEKCGEEKRLKGMAKHQRSDKFKKKAQDRLNQEPEPEEDGRVAVAVSEPTSPADDAGSA